MEKARSTYVGNTEKIGRLREREREGGENNIKMYQKGTDYEDVENMCLFSGRYCKHASIFYCSINRKFIDQVSNS